MDLNPVDNYLHGSWEALAEGAPMLVALAQLCNDAWVHRRGRAADPSKAILLPEARAILFAARARGVVEIRAVNSAFDAASRLLAVYVEVDEERTIAFRDASQPEVTLLFLEGFRNLCESGLVLHHIARDFTLSPQALQIARQIDQQEVAELLAKATEFGLHD
ncbi:MAG: hypothetical protein KDB22_22545 [Planctomycetales bacterium]|nr:hypothetical protein [Planctomycetales bacterium]